MRPLLNMDVGELPTEDEVLWSIPDLLNVACGGHAGDQHSIAAVVASAARTGARVGAHPSYPDRAGFGRTRMDLPADAVRSTVRYQCQRVADLTRVHHLKPHGALYHAADADPVVAAAVLDGAIDALGPDFLVLGPPGGALAAAAAARRLGFLVEGFADRARRPDGSLVPRGEPGAVLTDPAAAAAQARALRVDTVCVHGDTPGAIAIARAVRAALRA